MATKGHKRGGYRNNIHIVTPGNRHPNHAGVETYNKEGVRHVKVVDTRVYEDVTEEHINLRQEYAKSLVSNLTGIDVRRFSLSDMKFTYNEATYTENFKVTYNGHAWGRVAISVTTLMNHNRLQFVLMKKVFN